jgi:hypothetical protein
MSVNVCNAMLARNDVRNLGGAAMMALAAAAREREIHQELDRTAGPASPDDAARLTEALDRYQRAAHMALAIYDCAMTEVRQRMLADLRAVGLDDWADAYDRDDYSGLAI